MIINAAWHAALIGINFRLALRILFSQAPRVELVSAVPQDQTSAIQKVTLGIATLDSSG